ncbi:MAG TPA: amidohydrolase family protein [Mycobacteriales bacterium]|nr:amidohydrolase family protein [Mycobacteriales bacterium]
MSGAPVGATTMHLAPVVLPMVGRPLLDAGVVVAGERIAAVASRADLLAEFPQARVREWPGVMIPGLVNAHAHLEYGPPFADLATSGLAFAQWIQQMAGRRRGMTDADWLAAARGSVADLLRTGTTCVGDVVTIGPGTQAAARAALAGVSYLEVVGCDEAGWPAERARVLARMESAPSGRALGLSPHALYSISGPVVTATVALARERGWRLHTHLAESVEEAEYVRSGGGAIGEALQRIGLAHDLLGSGAGVSPAVHLDGLGGLGTDVHVAHGVHLDAADRARLRDRGTAVALCARSNQILAAGEPPVAALLAEGSPIAVGTDSLASSPSLDLLAELTVLHDLARAQGYDGGDLGERLVSAATIGGAAALGLADECGALVVGRRADLAVFDLPTDSPYDALVRSGAGRCVATVVAGRIVHRRAPLGSAA